MQWLIDMNKRGFQIEFERRLQLLYPELKVENKLNSDTIFSILDEAIDKFWKTRYSGLNYKQLGFEQNQKRIDDLRTLVKTKEYTEKEIKVNKNINSVELPTDYAILLGDTVGIVPTDYNKCWDKVNDQYVVHYGDSIESTIDFIDNQLNNSLSEHKLKYCKARPLRIIAGNNINLYTDGQYKVKEYRIQYLAKPRKLSSCNFEDEYTDLPEQSHIEIIKNAIQLYIATIGDNKYQIYLNEVNTME